MPKGFMINITTADRWMLFLMTPCVVNAVL